MFSEISRFIGQKLKIRATVSECIYNTKKGEVKKKLILEKVHDDNFGNKLIDSLQITVPKKFSEEEIEKGDVITFCGIIKKYKNQYKIYASSVQVKIKKNRGGIGVKNATFKTIRRTTNAVRSSRCSIWKQPEYT